MSSNNKPLRTAIVRGGWSTRPLADHAESGALEDRGDYFFQNLDAHGQKIVLKNVLYSLWNGLIKRYGYIPYTDTTTVATPQYIYTVNRGAGTNYLVVLRSGVVTCEALPKPANEYELTETPVPVLAPGDRAFVVTCGNEVETHGQVTSEVVAEIVRQVQQNAEEGADWSKAIAETLACSANANAKKNEVSEMNTSIVVTPVGAEIKRVPYAEIFRDKDNIDHLFRPGDFLYNSIKDRDFCSSYMQDFRDALSQEAEAFTRRYYFKIRDVIVACCRYERYLLEEIKNQLPPGVQADFLRKRRSEIFALDIPEMYRDGLEVIIDMKEVDEALREGTFTPEQEKGISEEMSRRELGSTFETYKLIRDFRNQWVAMPEFRAVVKKIDDYTDYKYARKTPPTPVAEHKYVFPEKIMRGFLDSEKTIHTIMNHKGHDKKEESFLDTIAHAVSKFLGFFGVKWNVEVEHPPVLNAGTRFLRDNLFKVYSSCEDTAVNQLAGSLLKAEGGKLTKYLPECVSNFRMCEGKEFVQSVQAVLNALDIGQNEAAIKQLSNNAEQCTHLVNIIIAGAAERGFFFSGPVDIKKIKNCAPEIAKDFCCRTSFAVPAMPSAPPLGTTVSPPVASDPPPAYSMTA